MKQSKNVRFYNMVGVMLIPDLQEYKEIKNEIWYTEDDFYSFYNQEYKRKKRVKIFKEYKSNILSYV